jgi:hypothetical protein
MFQKKSRNNVKILGAKKMSWGELHADDPQIWDAILQNSVARNLCTPGVVSKKYNVVAFHPKL